jgi:hypothetical protein
MASWTGAYRLSSANRPSAHHLGISAGAGFAVTGNELVYLDQIVPPEIIPALARQVARVV